MPVAKTTPPAKHMPTFPIPEESGVIIGIIMKSSIPPKSDRQIDIQLIAYPLIGLLTRFFPKEKPAA